MGLVLAGLAGPTAARPLEASAGAVQSSDGTGADGAGVAEAGTAAGEDPALPGLSERDRALLWRAGSGSVAGLTSTRRTERSADRLAALEELESALDGSSERAELLLAELRRDLTEPPGDAAWCTAVRIVGATRRYELAEPLARELDAEDTTALRRLVARQALRQLYGRWFQTYAEAEQFLTKVRPGEGTELLVDSALQADRLAVERTLERLGVLGEDPQRFLTSPDLAKEPRYKDLQAFLRADDTRLRQGAAGLIAKLARASEDPAVRTLLWQELASCLHEEVEPIAFETVVELLCDELFTRAIEEERLEEVRGDLLELAEGVEPGRAVAVAKALARLPWASRGGDGVVRLTKEHEGMRSLAGLLRRLLERDRADGPLEPEVLIGTISAVDLLLGTVDPSAFPIEGGDGVSELRSLLSRLLESGRETPEAARIAALGPYSRLARSRDLDLLLRQVQDPETPVAFVHALLGALAPRFRDLETDPDATADRHLRGAEFVRNVGLLLERTTDADLQRRALQLLNDPRLAGLIDQVYGPPRGAAAEVPRATGEVELRRRVAHALLELLGRERAAGEALPGVEVRGLALRLFGRLADPELLDGFLARQSAFDVMAAEARELGELTTTLASIAAGDPTRLLRIAKGLMAVDSNGARVARTRRAIGLVIPIDTAAAAAFEPRDHAEICSWALDLISSGVAPSDAFGADAEFRLRLLDVHLPQAEGGGGLVPWRAAYLRAQVLSSLALEALVEVDLAAVDAAFEQALAATLAIADAPAASNGAPAEPGRTEQGAPVERVRRALARWRLARPDPQPRLALEQYELLFGSPVLEVSDVRGVLTALEATRPAPAAIQAPYQSARVRWLRTLVEGASWLNEPTQARLQDLRAYVDAVLALPEDARMPALTHAAAFLSDGTAPAPEVAAPNGDVPEGAAPDALPASPWQALTTDAESLALLESLRARLRAALPPTTDSDDPPPPATGDPAPSDGAPPPGSRPHHPR